MRCSIGLWLFLSILCIGVHGQPLPHLTVANGLPNATVYNAMQDSRGFIWFCTETGVSRYDGRKFQNFTMSDGLADNDIFNSFEDSRGRIWFLSYNGRLSYFKSGMFYNSDNVTRLSYPATGAFLLQAAEDKRGAVWFSNSLGDVIRVDDSGVSQYKAPYFYRNNGEFYITAQILNDGDSLVKFVIDFAHGDIYLQHLPGGLVYVGKYADATKAPWPASGGAKAEKFFATDSGLACYLGNGRLGNFNARRFGITSRVITCLPDGDQLWLASEQGVFRVDLSRNVVTKVLEQTFVIKMMKDAEGDVWLVTHDDGVYIVRPGDGNFQVYNTGNTFCAAVTKIANETYAFAGNSDGTVYRIADTGIASAFRPAERRFNRILDIIPYAASVFVGCDEGVYEYNPLNGRMHKEDALPGYKNYALAADSSVWFCSHSRIACWNRGSLSVLGNPLPLVSYTAVAPTVDSMYYAGTANELYFISEKSGRADTVISAGQLRTQVTAIKDVRGDFWVATHGSGIFVVHGRAVTRRLTRRADGLAGDICQDVYYDGGKYVYVATNEGISLIDAASGAVLRNIGTDAGLISADVRNITSDSQWVYAATAGGLIRFRLTDVMQPAPPPRVYITGFRHGDEQVTDPGEAVSFPYFKGFINVGFTAVSFRWPGVPEYEYKLGEESEWRKTLATDIPFFTLSPGRHMLQVRARTYSSGWSKPALLTIEVLPLWYQTAWAQIMALGLALLLAAYFVRARIRAFKRKARRENEHNQKIRNLESRALAAQMNPHFIFNSLNTVQQLILIKDEQQCLDFLTDFSLLMRKMLENSRRQTIPLSEEVDFLERYMQLERTRFSQRFAYRITVDDRLQPDDVLIPPALFQPLLENAIKHGISGVGDGFITLAFTVRDAYLVGIVEDNGVGIYHHQASVSPAGRKQESAALRVVEERVRLFRGKDGREAVVTITDKGHAGTGAGTVIEIKIPILA